MATPSADSEIPTEFTASGQTSLRDLFLEAAEITDPVAGEECDIRIWGTESGELGKRLRGHVDAVESLDYSLDGRWLASASRKGEIKVWTMNSGPSINAGLRFERVADYTLLARDGSGFVRYFCDAAVPPRMWSATPELESSAVRPNYRCCPRFPSNVAEPLLATSFRPQWVQVSSAKLQRTGPCGMPVRFKPRNSH